jgi:hypothetical protein
LRWNILSRPQQTCKPLCTHELTCVLTSSPAAHPPAGRVRRVRQRTGAGSHPAQRGRPAARSAAAPSCGSCVGNKYDLQNKVALGQRALRRTLSAPDRAPGCPELRPASANPPSWAALAGHLCRVSTYTHAHTYYICRCIYAFPCLCTCLCIPMRTHMHISTQCGSSLQVL